MGGFEETSDAGRAGRALAEYHSFRLQSRPGGALTGRLVQLAWTSAGDFRGAEVH